MTPEERAILLDLIERGELSAQPNAPILRRQVIKRDPFIPAASAIVEYFKAIDSGGDMAATRAAFLDALESVEKESDAQVFDELATRGIRGEAG